MDPRTRQVREIMRTEVVTLSPEETLDLGEDIMRLGRLRHMPVVEEGRLVGMVSDRDLYSRSLARALQLDGTSLRSFLRSVRVGSVMSTQLVTVVPDTPLAEAARLLSDRRISSLPVVDDRGRLCGLLTDIDLLAAAYLDAPADSAPS